MEHVIGVLYVRTQCVPNVATRVLAKIYRAFLFVKRARTKHSLFLHAAFLVFSPLHDHRQHNALARPRAAVSLPCVCHTTGQTGTYGCLPA